MMGDQMNMTVILFREPYSTIPFPSVSQRPLSIRDSVTLIKMWGTLIAYVLEVPAINVTVHNVWTALCAGNKMKDSLSQ